MQTSLATLQAGLARGVRLEYIEDRTAHGVDGGDLHRRAAAHVADSDVIVKIDCARVAWRDLGGLRARFRKDQALRIGIDPKVIEQAREVSGAVGAKFEMDIAGSELRSGIVGGRIVVADRPMFDGQIVEIDLRPAAKRGQETDADLANHFDAGVASPRISSCGCGVNAGAPSFRSSATVAG